MTVLPKDPMIRGERNGGQMQITIDGGKLAEALALVGGAVPSRATRSILQNVYIKAEPHQAAEIQGTDMQIGIRQRLPDAKVEGKGGLLIPFARLHGIIRELAGEKLTIKATEKQVTIKAPGATFKLVGEAPTDFPAIPEMPKEGGLEVKASALTDLIRRTGYAASDEESRYAIHGILLEVKGQTLQMIATDGKRLAWVEAADGISGKGGKSQGQKYSALMPGPGLRVALRKAMDSQAEDATVRLVFEEKRVLVETGQTLMAMTLIQGTFPNYTEVVPKDLPITVTIEREALERAVRRGALIATEGSHAVQIEFQTDKIRVGARISDVGEGMIEEPATATVPEPLEVHFNPRYLLDFLKVADAQEIRIGLKDRTSAVLLHDGDSSRYVVMPVTLDAGGKA